MPKFDYVLANQLLTGIGSQAAAGDFVLVAREEAEREWDVHNLRDSDSPAVSNIIEVIQSAVNGDGPSATRAASHRGGSNPKNGWSNEGDGEGDESDMDSDDGMDLVDLGEDEVEEADAEVAKDAGEDVVAASSEMDDFISLCGVYAQASSPPKEKLGEDLINLDDIFSPEGDLITLDGGIAIPAISTSTFAKMLGQHTDSAPTGNRSVRFQSRGGDEDGFLGISGTTVFGNEGEDEEGEDGVDGLKGPYTPGRMNPHLTPSTKRRTRSTNKDNLVGEQQKQREKDAAQDAGDGSDTGWNADQVVYNLPPDSPQKKTVKERVESRPTTILHTPFLASHYLKWNILGNFAMCVRCSPARGIPYDHLFTHMKDNHTEIQLALKRKGWYTAFLNDIKRALCLSQHPTPVSSHPRTNGLTLEQWRGLVRPTDGSHEPFEGLPTKAGLACTVPPCRDMEYPRCTENEATLAQHWRADHDDTYKAIHIRGRSRKVTMQTVFQGNAVVWFPVNTPSTPFSATASGSGNDADTEGHSLVDLLQAEASSMLGPNTMLPSETSVLIHPVFHDILMVTLWEVLDLSDVRVLRSMRPVPFHEASEKMQLLQLGVAASYFAIARSVPHAHGGTLLLITNGVATSTNRPHPPFSIPQQSRTLAKYMLIEIQLLVHILFVFNNPWKKARGPNQGSHVFTFDKEQTMWLTQLTEQLKEGLSPVETLADTIVSTLDSLYFPKSPEDAAFDRFLHPVVVYIAIMCLTEEGAPIPLAHIPVFLAKMQFNMRLRGYHQLYTLFAASHPKPAGSSDAVQRTTAQPSAQSVKVTGSSQQRKIPVRPKKAPPTAPPPIPAESRRSTRQRKETAKASSQGTSRTRTIRKGQAAQRSSEQDAPISSTSASVLEEQGKGEGGDSDYAQEGADSSDTEYGSKKPGLPAQAAQQDYDINRRAKELENQGGNEGSVKWYGTARGWVEAHLTETNISTYGSVRMMMHMVSVAQRSAVKRPCIQWYSDESMLFNNDLLEIGPFTDFIGFQIEELEQHICSNVLLGTSLAKMEIECDFGKMEDNQDTTTIGFGPLFRGSTGLLNPDAIKLLGHLEKKGLVGVQAGVVQWTEPDAFIWAEAVTLALRRLMVLCHILQGAPGRGTEEVMMQISNTTAGRRHVFIDKVLQTVVILSNYHKGASKTGKFNEVLRVLPYRLARLLFTLVRVVRPLELNLILRPMDKAQQDIAVKSYFSSLWVSRGRPFTADSFSKALADFFKLRSRDGVCRFRWIRGVRKWRHTIAAIHRRRLGDSKYTSDIAKGGSVADKQAGRSAATSAGYYAPEHGPAPGDTGMMNHYARFSARWHAFFGQKTSFDADHDYVV